MPLTITIPAKSDVWDEENEKFISTEETTIVLEHSLLSLSKWESKWKKSFLSDIVKKTNEEIFDYIRCMGIEEYDPMFFNSLSREDINRISNYINDPMTATTIKDVNGGKGHSRDIITNEIIYYWMAELNIPIECEQWHLNRLLTLIRVTSIKKQPPKKMGRGDVMRQNASLNRARKAAHGIH